jgi:hypothetical protein
MSKACRNSRPGEKHPLIELRQSIQGKNKLGRGPAHHWYLHTLGTLPPLLSLQCPLLVKLNIVPAGKGESFTGLGYESQVRAKKGRVEERL